MPTHLAYNQSEVTCSHLLWSLTTENQATVNRFKKTHFTKGPTAYTKLLSNGMIKRNNYHRNIKMKFGIISALAWCFILSNICISPWQFLTLHLMLKKNKISFACKNRGTFLFFHFLSFNIVAKQRATCFKEGEIKKCIGSPQLMNLTN